MSMISMNDILETIGMIKEENLDIRTITMGISLFDCAGDDTGVVCDRIYDKITKTAERLVPAYGKGVGESVEFGGLLGYAPIMKLSEYSCADFIARGGRIPAPIHSLKN